MHLDTVALGDNATANSGEFAISLASRDRPKQQMLIRKDGEVVIPPGMNREEAFLVAGAVLWKYSQEADEIDGPGIFYRLLDLLIKKS